MPLNQEDPAPTVRGSNQHGEVVEIDPDGPTVVYFYPRDGTPGCTTEADQFNREIETYRDAGVRVVGVSTDTVEDHAAFAEERGLDFDLLADPEGAIAGAFDVSVEGGTTPRITFVLKDGKVLRVHKNVRPDGHARRVLADLLEAGHVELGAP